MKITKQNKWFIVLLITYIATSLVQQVAIAAPWGTDETNTNTIGSYIIHTLWGGGDINDQQNSLLGSVAFVINTACLAAVAFLTVTSGLSFLAHTAKTGIPGGNVISSFWGPLRMAVTVFMLIPLGNGYSSIQYTMVALAELGDSMGDIANSKTVNYLAEKGTVTNFQVDSGPEILNAMIASELCTAYLNEWVQLTERSDKSRTVIENGHIYDSYTIYKSSIDYSLKADKKDYKKVCGSVAIETHKPTLGKEGLDLSDFGAGSFYWNLMTVVEGEEAAAQAFHQRLYYLMGDIQPTAQKIAKQIASDSQAIISALDDPSSINSANLPTNDEIVERLLSSANDYESAIKHWNQGVRSAAANAISIYMTGADSVSMSQMNCKDDISLDSGCQMTFDRDKLHWLNQAEANGWIALGLQFWSFGQMTVKAREKIEIDINKSDPNFSGLPIDEARLQQLNGRLNVLIEHINNKTGDKYILQRPAYEHFNAVKDSNLIEDDDTVSRILDIFHAPITAITYSASKIVEDDPLIGMQTMGHTIMNTAETLFMVIIGTKIASEFVNTDQKKGSIVGNVASKFPLIGSIMDKVTRGIKAVSDILWNLGSPIALGLLIAGIYLAYYLPFLPVMYWLSTAFGWVIFILQSFAIGPMWMAAHAIAEGDGFSSQQARQGYVLITSLLARAPLMVFAFCASLALMLFVGIFIAMVVPYISGVSSSGFAGISAIFVSIGLIGIMGNILISRSSQVIYEIPSEGLRWINGGHDVFGEKEQEHNTRALFMSTTSTLREGASNLARKAKA